MKTPIGSTFMFNIIILFVVIIFAFLAGIMSYYKAFKVNNRIVYAIEKFEGYNDASIKEINTILSGLGYTSDKSGLNCTSTYKGMKLVSGNSQQFRYCIYVDNIAMEASKDYASGEYFVYGVKTYMSIDLPVVEWIRIPIFTKTNQIYKFTDTKAPEYR